MERLGQIKKYLSKIIVLVILLSGIFIGVFKQDLVKHEYDKALGMVYIYKGDKALKKQELQDGEEELNKNKQEFESQIKDAEKELNDAKEKISEIENPKWYILDRNSNAGYVSFIQDTKSIENISKVFPVVFFIVATLISLTSMTRMVEEQRGQIGTLKALGYNKLQIMMKYIINLKMLMNMRIR